MSEPPLDIEALVQENAALRQRAEALAQDDALLANCNNNLTAQLVELGTRFDTLTAQLAAREEAVALKEIRIRFLEDEAYPALQKTMESLRATITRLEGALTKLTNEAKAIVHFPGMTDLIGVANQRCLELKITEAQHALAPGNDE